MDKVEVLFDGASFGLITDLTLTDSFLDPCQTMTASISADETRFNIVGSVRPGGAFKVLVNGAPQCSGIVDSVEIASSHDGGRIVSVTGRDLLSQMVDGNADPRIAMSTSMPFDEFCQKAFDHFGFKDVTIFEEYGPSRDLALGRAVKTKGTASKRRRKFKDPADFLRPKANEGGWQWFVRIAHRLGYHAWATPDGKGIVVGTPDYEQEPAYRLTSKRSQGLQGLGAANNVKTARARLDITGLPSHVYVQGKSTKSGEAKSFIGFAKNPKAPVFKPFFVVDEDSSTQAHCDAYARLILSRAQRNAQTYEATLRGLSDPETKRVYNVDTVAMVLDENCGVDGKMWVEQRTLRHSRAGQETSLKLIPSDALIMDYYVSDSLPPSEAYDEAKKKVVPLKDGDLGYAEIFMVGWREAKARGKAERGQ